MAKKKKFVKLSKDSLKPEQMTAKESSKFIPFRVPLTIETGENQEPKICVLFLRAPSPQDAMAASEFFYYNIIREKTEEEYPRIKEGFGLEPMELISDSQYAEFWKEAQKKENIYIKVGPQENPVFFYFVPRKELQKEFQKRMERDKVRRIIVE